MHVPGRGYLSALAFPALVGQPEPGDPVTVNTEALDVGLGTGGFALVVHLAGRHGTRPAPRARLVKARYTPYQLLVAGVEEPDSVHRAVMEETRDLAGLPVVIAELHSALPAVLAGLRAEDAALRVAYVMTDGGALPLWLSRTVAGLTEAGWLAGTVTAGQAFGGELEAVTVHSALLAARAVLHADVAVLAPGPGTAGTDSEWGFSGVAAGEAVNAVAALGGRPVGVLRLSEADPRGRHRGVSHHSWTSYGRVALAAADLPVPAAVLAPVRAAALVHRLTEQHRILGVEVTGLAAALAECPVPLQHMGRKLEQDGAYFLTAAVAGRHAARLVTSRR